jgi:hypothetical protein
MKLRGHRVVAAASIVLIALTAMATAQTERRPKKKSEQAAPATPLDRRDRIVAAPGTPFHGKEYWRAAAQCGGTYFKLNTTYADAAIRAKVVKPDPAAYAQFTKEADRASRTATAFFDAAERFLVADRKLARDDAVMTYDVVSVASGDRLKTIEAAVQAAKPCADFYKTCREAFPQTCNDPAAMAAAPELGQTKLN